MVGGYMGINIHGDVNVVRYLSASVESITFLDIFLAIKLFSLDIL
jgi:phospholipid/cholesterol/gamma-HCH transport system permease protein